MSDWEAFERYMVQKSEWEVRRLVFSGGPVSLEDLEALATVLSLSKSGLARVHQILAERKAAAAQEQRELADIYAEANDVDAAAERRQLADEYAQAQGYPAAGSFLGLLQPVFDLFEYGTPVKAGPQASASPVGHSMPESPNGEPLAAVSIRTLLGPPDSNSSKF